MKINSMICKICNKEYEKKNSYYNHIKLCKLQNEIKELKKENDDLKKENNETIEELKMKNTELLYYIDELKDENNETIKELKDENNENIKELKYENKKLKQELENKILIEKNKDEIIKNKDEIIELLKNNNNNNQPIQKNPNYKNGHQIKNELIKKYEKYKIEIGIEKYFVHIEDEDIENIFNYCIDYDFVRATKRLIDIFLITSKVKGIIPFKILRKKDKTYFNEKTQEYSDLRTYINYFYIILNQIINDNDPEKESDKFYVEGLKELNCDDYQDICNQIRQLNCLDNKNKSKDFIKIEDYFIQKFIE